LTLTIPSLIECRQSIAVSIQDLPYSTVKSVTQLAMNTVDSLGQTIRLSIKLSLAVNFVEVMHIKDKQMLVFNFIFQLFLTGVVSSLRFVELLVFREL